MRHWMPTAALIVGLAACSSSETPAPAASGGPSPGPDAGTDAGADADAMDGGPDAAAACPAQTGAGTKHGGDAVTADTTWKAADGPHTVTFGFSVAKGATLTIEPCTEVRIQAGYGVIVEGTLRANGTATQPITIRAEDPAKPFSYLQGRGGLLDLAYVTLENGGSSADPNGLGVLEVRGDPALPRAGLLRARNVTIKGSQQWGVALRDGATFTDDSDALAVSGAALGPVRASPRLAGAIPSGNYTGNTVDQITVVGDEVMSEDTTWHDRGVPYRVGLPSGDGVELRIGDGHADSPHVTFTIEAGVTIAVSPTGRIEAAKAPAGPQGAIVALGTSASPIVIRSAAASPAAGDWRGLVLVPDPLDRLDFVRVEHAGGPSFSNSFHCDPAGGGGFSKNEDAAIAMFGEPTKAFITNSTITSSAGDGIDRAYSGAPVDFLMTNTFEGVAGCKQSFPRDKQGACPATVPCP
jgi:hypothetical protein